MTYRAIVAVAGLCLLAGCAPQESAAPTAGGPPQTAPGSDPGKGGAPNIMTSDAPGGPGGGGPQGGGPRGGGGPGGGGMAPPPTPEPGAPLQPTPTQDKAIADAEKGADKKAIAAAYLARAVERQKDPKSHYEVRLPAALEDLKKALEADPENARAQRLTRYINGIIENTRKQEAAKGGGEKPQESKP